MIILQENSAYLRSWSSVINFCQSVPVGRSSSGDVYVVAVRMQKYEGENISCKERNSQLRFEMSDFCLEKWHVLIWSNFVEHKPESSSVNACRILTSFDHWSLLKESCSQQKTILLGQAMNLNLRYITQHST